MRYKETKSSFRRASYEGVLRREKRIGEPVVFLYGNDFYIITIVLVIFIGCTHILSLILSQPLSSGMSASISRPNMYRVRVSEVDYSTLWFHLFISFSSYLVVACRLPLHRS